MADTQAHFDMEQPIKPGSSRRTVFCFFFLIAALITAIILAAYYGAQYKKLNENQQASTVHNSDEVTVTIIHINDVYELMPLSFGGGLARLATVRKQMEKENPGNVIMVLAGDLISPSAIGTAKVPINGTNVTLAGRQMIDVMNLIPLDLATFGNHEFDVKIGDFQRTLATSNFQWLTINTKNSTTGQPFQNTTGYVVRTFSGIKIGFVGIASYLNKPTYVTVQTNLTQTFVDLQNLIDAHHTEWDSLIALTHLSVADDTTLASAVPNISLITGGHEHQNYLLKRGKAISETPDGFVDVAKADANAITAYIHELTFNVKTKELIEIESKLIALNDQIESDPVVLERCQYWTNLAFTGFASAGFNVSNVATVLPVSLDGREATVRAQACPLTTLVAKSMDEGFPGVQLSVFNTGGVRIDDVILPGPMYEYDVIRVLPFGNYIWTANVSGAALIKLLNIGVQSVNSGAYLAYYNVSYQNNAWWHTPTNSPIVSNQTYFIASIDYLLSGLQTPDMTWFHDGWSSGDESVTVIQKLNTTAQDTRIAFIAGLQREYGKPATS